MVFDDGATPRPDVDTGALKNNNNIDDDVKVVVPGRDRRQATGRERKRKSRWDAGGDDGNDHASRDEGKKKLAKTQARHWLSMMMLRGDLGSRRPHLLPPRA